MLTIQVPLFFLMLLRKEQQSHSLQVILTNLIVVTTTFRLDIFEVYNVDNVSSML